jgi:hypothetical protein
MELHPSLPSLHFCVVGFANSFVIVGILTMKMAMSLHPVPLLFGVQELYDHLLVLLTRKKLMQEKRIGSRGNA